ncbi:MAG: ATP-dependent RecD-like DNA helicase [Clostridia bacterium]|nr:ATP-dependent RecD-like DNA helicase [Clostridia bacterium]
MSEIITVTGTVEEIIYTNPDNGYTVCVIDSAEESIFTATGYMPFISEGESVALSGNWTQHPDYGEQFKAEYYETVLPSDEEAIVKYLGSGIISGIREATAKKLVAHFGTEILDIMLQNPERLAEIKGISREKAEKIGKSFAEARSMQNVVMFLQQYSITANMAVKIHSVLGSNAVEMIKKNPYILADMVDGIAFKTADTIAFNMGMPRNSLDRIKAGVKHILRDAAFTSGHVFLPKTVLIEHSVYTLKVEESEVEAAISALVGSKDIFPDNVGGINAYYLYEYYEAEYYISRRLIALVNSEQKFTMNENEAEWAIDAYEAESDIHLATEQRSAVVTALMSGCMVLTGGPGTGKTTTINTIIKLLEDLKLSIALAAPTGRAAKRMSQITGCEAKTIHRLLGVQRASDGYNVFTHNEENPLSADVIILDEVSMIDITLMSAFLKAVKRGARVIFSGDADQLPSVGPGNIIHDMIESKTIPVIQLNQIFRQAEESLIIVNAHRINHGELPELKEHASDFFFLKRRTPEESAYTIADLFKNRLPKSYEVDPLSSIQIISPTKKGLAGTVALNKLLQSHINPYDELRPQYAYGSITFRVGDKVMQTKNNYDIPYTREKGEDGTGIFNGDMGIIEAILVRDKLMVIVFDEDKRVEYPFTNLDELDLAYAITVHKSQGSEFPIVVMPVCSFAPMLMSRNLFYTAVTRAKDMVVLVGSEKTVANMTMNNQYRERFTGLCEKLVAVRKFTDAKSNT